MEQLVSQLQQTLAEQLLSCVVNLEEVTIEVPAEHIVEICKSLRDEDGLQFEQLTDLCAVDYLHYGKSEWDAEEASGSGFSRGVEDTDSPATHWDKPRFAVVYHLLSYTHNQRLRVRAFVEESNMMIDSVCGIWAGANWFEREAFDLYGVLFVNHPDLRRILTDYGFIGHPFRKDFPLIGEVEMRYDATEGRCVYEPVSIEPRVLVPKVIRDDLRYARPENEE